MPRRFWWNCQHKKSTSDAVYCTKYDNYCLKNKCEELYDHKRKLQQELECDNCEGLSIDLDDPKPYLCMYDDHYSKNNMGLYKKCPKKEMGL